MPICELSPYIVDSNSNIETSKFIGLLVQHHPEAVTKEYQLFNEAIITKYYNPGDTILVEDSWKKKKSEFLSNHFSKLSIEQFRVKGWDDPDSIEAAKIVKDKLNLVVKAINELQGSDIDFPFSKMKPSFVTLINFLEEYKQVISLSQFNLGLIRSDIQEVTPIEKIALSIQTQMLIHSARKQMDIIRSTFAIRTFPIRQRSLIQRSQHCLNKRPNNKVIVLMGKSHAIRLIPECITSVESLEQNLRQTTFTILNGLQNKPLNNPSTLCDPENFGLGKLTNWVFTKFENSKFINYCIQQFSQITIFKF